MKTQNRALILTPDHLRYGLTSAEMTAEAGIPVAAIGHDKFLHSQELRKNGSLSEGKRNQRKEDVASYLTKEGLGDFLPKAGEIAEERGHAAHSRTYFVDFSCLQPEGAEWWNPLEINRFHLLPAGTYRNSRDRWVVIPKLPDSSIEECFSSPTVKFKAMVITESPDEAPNIFWAVRTGLPVSCIRNAPDIRVDMLIGIRHEGRHLKQIADYSKPQYCNELDAELSGRADVKNQAASLEISPREDLHMSLLADYALFMISDPDHQIAPAIEACEKGNQPPTPAVLNAVMNDLCDRIGKLEKGRSFLTAEERVNIRKRAKTEPEVIYGLRRRCVQAEMFIPDSLSAHIANQILSGVEHFSPGLTRNPDIVRKIYPARQGL